MKLNIDRLLVLIMASIIPPLCLSTQRANASQLVIQKITLNTPSGLPFSTKSYNAPALRFVKQTDTKTVNPNSILQDWSTYSGVPGASFGIPEIKAVAISGDRTSGFYKVPLEVGARYNIYFVRETPTSELGGAAVSAAHPFDTGLPAITTITINGTASDIKLTWNNVPPKNQQVAQLPPELDSVDPRAIQNVSPPFLQQQFVESMRGNLPYQREELHWKLANYYRKQQGQTEQEIFKAEWNKAVKTTALTAPADADEFLHEVAPAQSPTPPQSPYIGDPTSGPPEQIPTPPASGPSSDHLAPPNPDVYHPIVPADKQQPAKQTRRRTNRKIRSAPGTVHG